MWKKVPSWSWTGVATLKVSDGVVRDGGSDGDISTCLSRAGVTGDGLEFSPPTGRLQLAIDLTS